MYYTYQSRRRKRKEERNMMNKNQKRSQIVKNILLKDGLYIERTNSWHKLEQGLKLTTSFGWISLNLFSERLVH